MVKPVPRGIKEPQGSKVLRVRGLVGLMENRALLGLLVLQGVQTQVQEQEKGKILEGSPKEMMQSLRRPCLLGAEAELRMVMAETLMKMCPAPL
jgi:hypothetical protein